MKKVICNILSVFIILSLTACANLSQEVHEDVLRESKELTDSKEEPIGSYKKEHAPSQLVKTNSYWVFLLSTYGGSDYEISVSANPEEMNPIYAAKDVSIWFMEANDNYVVWSEKSESLYQYKVYSIERETVETFHEADVAAGHQAQNVGVFEDRIYFSNIDYVNQKADILCYDTISKQVTSVYSLPYQEDLSIMCFSVEGNYMNVAYATGIAVLDLDSGKVVQEAPLPEDVTYVFAISYDSVNDNRAIYYADSDSEDIGIVSEDSLTVKSHLTFNKNHYAYQDKIKCLNGHLYWISQANISGNVSDHYRFVDYDYLQPKPIETKRAFSFYVNGNDIYYLKFDRDGEYQNIELYKQ